MSRTRAWCSRSPSRDCSARRRTRCAAGRCPGRRRTRRAARRRADRGSLDPKSIATSSPTGDRACRRSPSGVEDPAFEQLERSIEADQLFARRQRLHVAGYDPPPLARCAQRPACRSRGCSRSPHAPHRAARSSSTRSRRPAAGTSTRPGPVPKPRRAVPRASRRSAPGCTPGIRRRPVRRRCRFVRTVQLVHLDDVVRPVEQVGCRPVERRASSRSRPSSTAGRSRRGAPSSPASANGSRSSRWQARGPPRATPRCCGA